MKNNKAQLGNLNTLATGVIVLFIAATFLIFGLMMLEELKADTNDLVATVRNETITPTDAGVQFATNNSCGFDNVVVSYVSNKTSAVTITSGNYSVYKTGSNWYIKNLTSRFPQSWNVTYTYEYGTDVCDAADSTIVGIGKVGDYIDLIVLAIVISIILGLIIAGFALRKGKQ